MTCGFRRAVDGREPLVCELEAGHQGRHALLNGPIPYCWFDDAPPPVVAPAADRFAGWRKPHVRRKYQTTKQWKQERGI